MENKDENIATKNDTNRKRKISSGKEEQNIAKDADINKEKKTNAENEEENAAMDTDTSGPRQTTYTFDDVLKMEQQLNDCQNEIEELKEMIAKNDEKLAKALVAVLKNKAEENELDDRYLLLTLDKRRAAADLENAEDDLETTKLRIARKRQQLEELQRVKVTYAEKMRQVMEARDKGRTPAWRYLAKVKLQHARVARLQQELNKVKAEVKRREAMREETLRLRAVLRNLQTEFHSIELEGQRREQQINQEIEEEERKQRAQRQKMDQEKFMKDYYVNYMVSLKNYLRRHHPQQPSQ